MRRPIAKLTGSLAALLATVSAPASAQVPAVGCEVSDFSMALSLFMPLMPDGTGAPGSQGMQGTVELRHSKIPKDKSRWTLDGRKPAMYWNRGGELKVLILLGSGDGLISISIEASNKQGGDHIGSFRLETGEVKLTGRLACTVG